MGMSLEHGAISGVLTTLELGLFPSVQEWSAEVQDKRGTRRVPIASELVVGSSPLADIIVHDRAVSARHCTLRAGVHSVTVEDLGSKNGTFVGAARIREARAGEGTAITIGRSIIAISGRTPGSNAEPCEASLPGVAGRSLAMREVAVQVRRLAKNAQTVLVSAETGCGKELVARAIHSLGPRAHKPFIAVNVATLPRDLIESELFGHERGAFSGAVASHAGAFEAAEGGTLFLDEIGELPLEAQPKLLRALDGYDLRRVGESGSGKKRNVRVVAATHVPLEQYVAEGRFRRDLFHRLEVFVVRIPPLRDRRGDIPVLAHALLDQLNDELGYRELTSSATARLAAHDFPGNVRELRNVLCRAADFATGRRYIETADVDRALRIRDAHAPLVDGSMARLLFSKHQSNLTAAAREAGCPRTSFRRLLQS